MQEEECMHPGLDGLIHDWRTRQEHMLRTQGAQLVEDRLTARGLAQEEGRDALNNILLVAKAEGCPSLCALVEAVAHDH